MCSFFEWISFLLNGKEEKGKEKTRILKGQNMREKRKKILFNCFKGKEEEARHSMQFLFEKRRIPSKSIRFILSEMNRC